MKLFKNMFRYSAMAAGACIVAAHGAHAASQKDVLNTYADIAHAEFEDALIAAQALGVAVDALIAEPSDASLAAAKAAWLFSRGPYQQTEVYRFGNTIVDDWEGRVNAWPLDEGLIDYVDMTYGVESDSNALYTVNVVANKKLNIGGQMVDASNITPALLQDTLHEAEEVEANVATGYHAIEFLLWGQDTNGTGPGAGARPATDYDINNCTNGNCDRRGDYLKAATDLLISDLEEMVANWTPDGAGRQTLLADTDAGVVAILTGMGSLSYGELAGERMKLGLMLKDPEEEHDCFADNTHNSHYFDVMGIRNVYTGTYRRLDGTVVSGPSISDLIAEADSTLDESLRSKLDETMVAMAVMRSRAESIEAYDQMLGEGNEAGNAVIQAAVDALVNQTADIERAVAALNLDNIEFEGSDSLDNPSAVFN